MIDQGRGSSFLSRRRAVALLIAGAFLPLHGAAAGEQDGLRLVEWQWAAANGIGVRGVVDLAVGPGGEGLYAATTSPQEGLTIYRREPTTGALSALQEIVDGSLVGVVDVALSPDGVSAYAAALGAGRVVRLDRDPDGFTLSGPQAAPDPVAGAPLVAPSGAVVTPDGSQLLAVGFGDSRLFVYDRDADGELSAPATFDLGLIGARNPALSADGRHLYVPDLCGDRLIVVERTAGGGAQAIQLLVEGAGGVSGLDGPRSAALSPDGADLYVAGFDGDTLAQFRRDPATGLLTPGTVIADPTGALGLRDPIQVAVDGEGGRVLATGSDPGSLSVFARDPMTGGLSFTGAVFAAEVPGSGLEGAAGLATHGRSIYVGAFAGDAISHFERMPAGLPRHVETQYHATPQVLFPHSARLTAGGSVVHLLGFDFFGCPGGCIGYSGHLRDPESGALTAVLAGDFSPFVIHSLTEAAASPDARHLYLASFNDDALLAVAVQPDGHLAPIDLYADGAGGIEGLGGVVSVAVAPGGAHVYAASSLDGRIAAFARDGATGELSFLSSVPAPLARRLVLSPDGRHLYVAQQTQQVVAFARDPASGTLSQVDVETEGVGGVSGIANPLALAFSPDGRNLYVTDDVNPLRVTAFARDPQGGTLSFVESRPGVGGAGAPGPTALAVSVSGGHVYVGTFNIGTLSVYRRDRSDGRLTLVRTIDGNFRRPPLIGTLDLTVSPDGRHLYAAVADDGAVAAFATDVLFADGFESGDTAAWSRSLP